MKKFAIAVLFALSLCCVTTQALAQKTTPQNTPVPSQDIPEWQARLELADLMAGAERFDEAEAQYRKVLKAQPDNEAARQGLARVLAWTGRNDEAVGLFTKLPNERMTVEDRMLLADHHIGRKEYDKAVLQLNAILTEQPDADDSRLKLAQVLSWDGKLDKSIEQYELILKRHPDDIQVRRKYAQVLSWAGRKDDAIKELKRTLD